jgi:hypothetical protein
MFSSKKCIVPQRGKNTTEKKGKRMVGLIKEKYCSKKQKKILQKIG